MNRKLLLIALITFSYYSFAQGPMTPSSTSVTFGSDWTTTNLTADQALDFPWEITYGPDNNLWVTERAGEKIIRISTTGGTITTMIDLNTRVEYSKQGGLMGMAVHPALYNNIATTTNNYVFVSYSYDDGSGLQLRIARLVYNNASGTLSEDASTGNPSGAILEGLPASADHNSGRLIFGPDEKLYYTIGDQGANQFDYSCNPVLAQVLPTYSADYDNYPGKTLRFNIDGSIPTDNPVLNGVQSHVNTYGHRNAQGIIFAQDGTLYASEHGAKVDDEINVIQSGNNYGWPQIAGYYDDMAYTYCNWSSLGGSCNAGDFSDHNCPSGAVTATEYESFPTAGDLPANFTEPIGTYGSTTATDPPGGFLTWPTIAPSSIDIHEVGNIPGWGRSLLIPSLKKGTIYRAKLTPDGDDIVGDAYEEFHSSNDRYRDVAISPDGLSIYAVTDNSGGTSGPSSGGGVTIENGGTIVKIQYMGSLVVNPPVANCQDIAINLDPNGTATILASQINNGSTGGDAGIDTITIDIDTFDCSHTDMPQTVYLTVTDNDGNEDKCSATVTVMPNASPNTITAPALDDIVSNCTITVAAPSVISNGCVEIIASTTDQTTYTSGQSGVINWDFDDNGTVVTSQQNVLVNALPVPTNIIVTPGSISADVTWDNIDDVTFDVQYREVGSGTWLNETTATNSITITGLTLTTDYELQVRSDCGSSQSAYSSPITLFSTTDITYCVSQGANGGHISNVQIYGEGGTFIDNSSFTNTDYTDYTAVTPVNLNADGVSAYTLSVSTNYGDAGISVWIDLNQDGVFDNSEGSTEKVWNDATGTTGASPRTKSISMPYATILGNTRMRVSSRQYWTPGGSCGTIVEGGQSSEVEDYTVNIVNPTLSVAENTLEKFMMYPNPAKNEVNIKLPSDYNFTSLEVTLFDIQGRLISKKTVTNSERMFSFNNLNDLKSGIYFVNFDDGNTISGSKKLIKL